MRKTIALSLIVLLALIFITWLYPYSILSVHKSFSFKPDPIVVKEYTNELKSFKNDEIKNSKGNLTKEYTQQFILELYEQDWLTQDKSTNMNSIALDKMLQKVKETIQDLLLIVVQMDYSKEKKQYLVSCIENLSSLENEISAIQSNRNLSRYQIKIEYDNLNQSFFASLHVFRTFYEVAQGK